MVRPAEATRGRACQVKSKEGAQVAAPLFLGAPGMVHGGDPC